MKILRYFTVSLALVMLLVTSCTKEEIEVAPEVSLEPVASEMTSVTFRITSENAVDAAYIRLKDLTQVPSASTRAGCRTFRSYARRDLLYGGCSCVRG